MDKPSGRSSSRGRNNNHRKKNSRRRQGGGGQGQGQRRPQEQKAQGRSQNNPRSRRSHNRRPRRSGQGNRQHTEVEIKYLNMLEQHLVTRRKFFEKFDRVHLQERKALERKFFNTIEQLREFESKLSEEQREKLQKLTNSYRYDSTYSNNHELPFTPEPVSTEGDFEDPHQLLSQKNRESYAEDIEESEGSYEDYQRYKGLF